MEHFLSILIIAQGVILAGFVWLYKGRKKPETNNAQELSIKIVEDSTQKYTEEVNEIEQDIIKARKDSSPDNVIPAAQQQLDRFRTRFPRTP